MTEMIDGESLMANRFAALATHDSGDWLDVRRRARRMHRHRLALVLAATFVAAAAAAPALGIGGRLLDLIQGPPAPPDVQTYFAANDGTREKMFAYAEEAGEKLHDRYSPVIASAARGVFAIDSADGPIYLWAAPTEDGRQCWLIQAGAERVTGRPFGLGGCDGPSDETSALSPGLWWTAERPNVEIVYVRVYDTAIARIEVEREAASAVSLPVVSGYALGTVAKEERVLAIVGRNADGDEVARFTVRRTA
jgi:hypothetical protein